jgi:hypothetical protein
MWKEAFMTYIKVLSQHLHEGTGENPENLTEDIWLSG